jgi:hypothetical protein
MIKLLKTKEFEDSQREVTCYQERTPVHLTAGFLPEPMAARRLKSWKKELSQQIHSQQGHPLGTHSRLCPLSNPEEQLMGAHETKARWWEEPEASTREGDEGQGKPEVNQQT